MSDPVILAVSPDRSLLERLRTDLTDHYGRRYGVEALASADQALESLARLGGQPDTQAEPVALVIVDHPLENGRDTELFQESARLHPDAKRVMLIAYGDLRLWSEAGEALTLGLIDGYVPKPWKAPEEWLLPVTSELLSDWAELHLPHYEMVRAVGSRLSPFSYAVRSSLSRTPVPHGFYWDDEPAGRDLLEQNRVDRSRLPAFVMDDGRVLQNPRPEEIVEALGGQSQPNQTEYDVAIIGSGPAGLAAAVYGASEGLRTVVIEQQAIGGQAGTSSMIRNYMGFQMGVSGRKLTVAAWRQATTFGAEVVFTQKACALRRRDGNELILSFRPATMAELAGIAAELPTEPSRDITARTVVIANGADWRRLPAADAKRLPGVYYGASPTEAQAMKDRDVFVVGGGNSAGQAVANLSRYARCVTLLVRGPDVGATMSEYLVKQITSLANVQVETNSEVADLHGDGRLMAIDVRSPKADEVARRQADALFIMIGAEPRTEWLGGSGVECDEKGFVCTGVDLSQATLSCWRKEHGRDPFYLETSLPGVFAGGDVRHNSVKRVASAAGEGATAIQLVHQFLRTA